MKSKLTALLLIIVVICMQLCSCDVVNGVIDSVNNMLNPPVDNPNDTDEPDVPGESVKNYIDVYIFMGQSNMAGRGEAKDAIPCAEGHGYEYRAVDMPDCLSPIEEPFGATENNDRLSDKPGDSGKTGSMVSSFCEAYYQKCGVPVVGISASVGGSSITEWVPGTDYYEESVARLQACFEYLYWNTEYEIRHINMVWCQGESDAGASQRGELDYEAALKSIVDELQAVELEGGYSLEKCVIIPFSEYNSSDGSISSAKRALVEKQMTLCENDDDFVLATLKFRNVPIELRDDPHFHQGVYNVCGWDAGERIATYLETGTLTECTEFVPGEEVTLAEKFGIELTYKSNE